VLICANIENTNTMYRKTEFNRNLWSRSGITRHFGLFLALFCVSFHVTLGLKYYYGDGSYFIGEVDEHGRPSGHGQFHNTSGALEYDGEFSEGHPHGYGTWYGEDGAVFKGQFRYGRSSGKATYVKPNGDKIEGDFLNLRPHGKIVLTKATKNVKLDVSLNGSKSPKATFNFEENRSSQDNTSSNKKLDSPSDSVTRNNGNINRIEGEFRNGMAHGSLQLWYHNPDGKLIKIEGVYRMGQPHGYFRFMNEEDGILTEAKYLNGEPLENLNPRQNLKSKQLYLFKIPRKIVL